MNTTKHEKTIKALFVGKCWEYLNDNFHKFTNDNKIKIALALASKDLPTELSGKFISEVTTMGAIVRDNKPLAFSVGGENDRSVLLHVDPS